MTADFYYPEASHCSELTVIPPRVYDDPREHARIEAALTAKFRPYRFKVTTVGKITEADGTVKTYDEVRDDMTFHIMASLGRVDADGKYEFERPPDSVLGEIVNFLFDNFNRGRPRTLH
jgi:hypothetical protein